MDQSSNRRRLYSLSRPWVADGIAPPCLNTPSVAASWQAPQSSGGRFSHWVFIFDYPILKCLGQFDATYVLKVES